MPIRIDKWLWHAHFFRTRTLAQAATTSGLLRLNGHRVEKPGTTIKPGDLITLPRKHEILVVRVLGTGLRRGPFQEAKTLYETVENTVLEQVARGP